MPDPTFTDIVVPGAKAALDWAKKASPLKDCKKVRTALARRFAGHLQVPDGILMLLSSEGQWTGAVLMKHGRATKVHHEGGRVMTIWCADHKGELACADQCVGPHAGGLAEAGGAGDQGV